MQKPDIYCNIDIKPAETVKKYVGSTHGISVLALTLIDPNSHGVEFSIKYSSEQQLLYTVTQLIDVWCKYAPVKTFLRSCCVNGVYQTEYNDVSLEPTQNPTNLGFGLKTAAVDLDIKDNVYTFTVFRLNENSPRMLVLSVKSPL
jgi:hypothetical protein